MTGIMVRVPEEVHAEFRILCFRSKVSMTKYLGGVIADAIARGSLDQEEGKPQGKPAGKASSNGALPVDLPAKLQKRFRAVCKEWGTDPSETIANLVDAAVAEQAKWEAMIRRRKAQKTTIKEAVEVAKG